MSLKFRFYKLAWGAADCYWGVFKQSGADKEAVAPLIFLHSGKVSGNLLGSLGVIGVLVFTQIASFKLFLI